MKNCLNRVFVALMLLAVGIAANCSSVSHETIANVPAKPANLHETPSPTPAPAQASVLDADEITSLKKFAESYQPKRGREVIPSPPVPSERISQIIAKAANANSREHEKYVVLIFIRIWRFHLENFRKGYELGRTNPLTREFYRLIGRNDFETREANHASLAEEYVERKPELRQYASIDAEMRRIARMGERIKSDLEKLKGSH